MYNTSFLPRISVPSAGSCIAVRVLCCAVLCHVTQLRPRHNITYLRLSASDFRHNPASILLSTTTPRRLMMNKSHPTFAQSLIVCPTTHLPSMQLTKDMDRLAEQREHRWTCYFSQSIPSRLASSPHKDSSRLVGSKASIEAWAASWWAALQAVGFVGFVILSMGEGVRPSIKSVRPSRTPTRCT